jgi:TolB-like protein
MEVKMKGLLAGLAVLVCIGCVTVDNVREFRNLDLAVDQSCQNIQSDFNETASIAVFNIVSPSTRLSEYIIEEVMNSFTNMHKYNVVERNKISSVFQEQDFQMSGNVSDDTIQSIGNMLGAQFVVSGTLDDVGNYYRLRLFVIAVASGERKSSTAVNIIKPNQQVVHLLDDALEISSANTENRLHGERVIKGYLDIFSELERILNDIDSPVTYVFSAPAFSDSGISNAAAGLTFTTFEELKGEARWMADNPPDEEYEARKISGEWTLINALNYKDIWGRNRTFGGAFSDSTYRELIENVIDGNSAIAIVRQTEQCSIRIWH